MFSNPDLLKFIFGRLTLDAIPYHEPILVVTFIGVAIGAIAVLGIITYFKFWGPLWRDWIASARRRAGTKTGAIHTTRTPASRR